MNTSAIKKIKDFKTLVLFLSEELNWPIDPENVDVEDLVFDYTPEDIGLREEFATKVNSIKQIRPLDPNQPWSIFWIDFENKKLPLTVLRRILNVFVTKKRGNSRNLATRALEDIMFVSGHGEDQNRSITFAHFKRLDDIETIREFYWDGHETKFDNISKYLESLNWPTNTHDVDAWRAKWKGAFTGSTREAITTSDQLAKAMANIAKNIRDRVLEVLLIEHKNGPVHKLYDTFKTGLVHDMTETGFADMYAQTITYGLFSARTMDSDGHFELQEVIDLIPTTNPFLKSLFKECLKTGDNKHKINLDELGVGSLVDLFDNLNRSDGNDTMQRILEEFGRQTFSGHEDPVIHFYEGFLCEYDSIQRVEKGVYYTPDPVVSFIVRSVNEQLKSEFGLEMGLADTTTWAEMVASGRAEFPVDPKTGKINNEWKNKIKGRAFVQILDPAAGTGTFLKYVIEIIHEEVKAKYKQNRIQTPWLDYWNDYVYRSLLPRIYGFELMMAPYSVAHMKIGMYLKSLGYKFEKEQRLNIYLTNSLEPYTTNYSPNLFFDSVGTEAEGANRIKQDRCFSVVLGNPPYNTLSKNSGDFILRLLEDYKYVDGKHFGVRKHHLNDSYVKFIRFSQSLIVKNKSGIISIISNNGYIDNPTFSGMRQNLINNFNKVFIINLNGDNTIKNDENVFDIKTAVAIGIFIRHKNGNEIKYNSIEGKRDSKYSYLSNNTINKIDFKKLVPNKPDYLLKEINFSSSGTYNNYFKLDDFFIKGANGIVTCRDELLIKKSKTEVRNVYENLMSNFPLNIIRVNLNVGEDSGNWTLKGAINDLRNCRIEKENIVKILYRPFDFRFTYFTGNSGGYMARPAGEIMSNYLSENIGLVTAKRNTRSTVDHFFITKSISEAKSGESTTQSKNFPLFIDSNSNKQQRLYQTEKKIPNIKKAIIEEISKKLGLFYTLKKVNSDKSFSPIDLFDYIYAILYSPTYREKYKEFLKRDYPRIPYPKDKDRFWQLVNLGSKLRKVHLLEDDSVNDFVTEFHKDGDNMITKINYSDGKVWINKAQYFSIVKKVVWDFYIGGYQPAQKWLKERKGCALSDYDILHYQKIIVALTKTDQIMKEIDKIGID